MTAHPNAMLALVTGAVASGVVGLLNLAGVTVPPAAAAGAATALVTAVLAVGRNGWHIARAEGLAGLWRVILHGRKARL